MVKLVVVIIFQYIFLKKNVSRKGGWKNPSSLLFFMYFCIAIFSIPHLMINGDSSVVKYTMIYGDKYWIGTFVYIFYIFLFLSPLYYFKETRITEIRLPTMQVLNAFSSILIILSIYSIAFYFPSIIRMFRSGVALSVLRNNLGTVRSTYVNTGGIANTIASVAAGMYPFAIMLFYVYYIIGHHRIFCMLLFIASTSGIISVLSFVGRDGIVFWLFMFAFCYLIFKNYLNLRQIKKVQSVFVLGATIAIIPFIAISISRFSGSTGGNGTLKGILSYLGQMVPNYLLYFDVKDKHFNYGLSFPLYWKITHQKAPASVRWIDGGTESNVFGTLIKSLNTSLGMWGTLLWGGFALILFICVFYHKRKTISFHHYFIYLLYIQVLSEGIFYFREYTRGGNLFIIMCFLFYFAFTIIEKHFGTFILQKNIETEVISSKKKVRFIIKRKV